MLTDRDIAWMTRWGAGAATSQLLAVPTRRTWTSPDTSRTSLLTPVAGFVADELRATQTRDGVLGRRNLEG